MSYSSFSNVFALYIYSYFRFIKIVEDTLRKERLLSESLLRLKKKKPGSVSTAIADSSTTELTDEDKIRMQIRLDVELFGKEIEKRGVEASSIVKFLELVSATEKS